MAQQPEPLRERIPKGTLEYLGSRLDGEQIATPPLLIDRYAECEPVYETMPGWSQATTSSVTADDALPAEAKNYMARIEALVGAPIDIVSTGPSRDAVIIRRHPFGD